MIMNGSVLSCREFQCTVGVVYVQCLTSVSVFWLVSMIVMIVGLVVVDDFILLHIRKIHAQH